ncbi:MAG TPA: efflux RND transporter permease subunit [Alphaproteobacteria bacterium]
MNSEGKGLIGLFARHRTAANLVMILMIVAGALSLKFHNTQFFPDFEVDFITVSIDWPGASAADVEANIVEALEPELRFLDDVKTVLGTAREGVGQIAIEFEPNADMQGALSAVENAVSQVTTLPEDAEQPVIKRIAHYDTVSRLVVSGPFPEASLKAIAKRMREELLAEGIDKITLFGARDEEVWVDIDEATLLRLDLTLGEVAAVIGESSLDLPSGDTRGGAEQQIRSLGLMRDAESLGGLEVKALDSGEKIRLADIAALSDGFEDGQPIALHDGMPAVELHIQRAIGNDALKLAGIVKGYLERLRPTLPPTLSVIQYDVAASLIRDRINLLLRNGLSGLVLVVGVLFVFLSAGVAFWVAAGIPVSVLAGLAVMLATGQSINMVSLFALIMMLGIIVDDAIVVGEHALARRLAGMPGPDAAEAGARRMLPPVMAASLTTIAAFVPVALVSDIIGQILRAIPLVVVAVLIASLIECFLVLPGHMRGVLSGDPARASRLRRRFNAGFEAFRDGPFRRFVTMCVRWRYATIGATVAMLLVSVGLVIGGRIQFVFFPSPESDVVYANFSFAPGTPRAQSEAMIAELDRSLKTADARLGGGEELVRFALAKIGVPVGGRGETQQANGDHLGGMIVEMVPSELRAVRTGELIEAWRAEIEPLAGLETLTVQERQGGPPGRDLDIRLSGAEPPVLKAAALDLRDLLTRYPGVSDIGDDLPWGKQELVLEVTPRGRALGFTTERVGRQVRDAFEGAIARRFARGDEEVLVRVQLPRESVSAGSLESLYLRAPGGAEVPLSQVVDVRETRGFAVISRENGAREVSVAAEIDESRTNPTELVGALGAGPLTELKARTGVGFRFAGKAEEQGKTLGDMKTGAVAGLSAIYIILAWVFASFSRPIIVMSIIPFALVGAIFGHMALGFDLTILSLIGLLGLSGIVVNDSIILVSTIDERLGNGEPVHGAIVQGACDRLRAVILTSLTTIGGLTPLLFETSLQAQFLKPMALTLVFGLLATTILVLIVVPALVAIQDDLSLRRRRSAAPEIGQEQDLHRKQLEAAE